MQKNVEPENMVTLLLQLWRVPSSGNVIVCSVSEQWIRIKIIHILFRIQDLANSFECEIFQKKFFKHYKLNL